ncbi:MAG TPA: beta-ketoacyl synthase N-terminal-like domain-containing protein [Mycobacteriales bacterium]|nr:beta-ketoacyl synthase N-terminal-like domain-containing protein [Mycobacteriales bacterium]
MTAPVPTAITGVGWAVSGVPGFDPETALTRRGMLHKDRASRFALLAAEAALGDAGLLGAPELAGAAVVLSSNYANLDTVCDFVATIAADTSAGIRPMRIPHMSSHVTAAWVALQHGIRGPNLTLCNGAAGGLDAVAWARTLIAAGRATAALVIGVEPDTGPVARLHRETGGRRWIDGAVGVVVEPTAAALGRGGTVRAGIGGYARADDEATAVRAALAGAGARRLDGEAGARFGRCSGALGVVQCALAVEQLAGGPVLAVAGADPGEADATSVSALVLTPPGSTP